MPTLLKASDLVSPLSTSSMPKGRACEALKIPSSSNSRRSKVSHDRRTMTRYFRERLAAGKSNPGLFIIPQRGSIGEVIESLLLVWIASEASEWRDSIMYLPFR